MSGYILRDSEPSIVLTADQVDRLVKNGDGDAALLYLHKLSGGVLDFYHDKIPAF